MSPEVTVQIAWVEELLKLANRSAELLDGEYVIMNKYDLAHLLGFISSASEILKG